MVIGVDTRREFDGLFSLYEWVTGVTVAVVFFVTLFALVRYRSRRDDTGYARGRSDAKIVESLYALGLLAIAVVLVAATFRTEAKTDRVDDSAPRIRVTAFQWQWRFDVGERTVIGTNDRPATLLVPARRPVTFVLTSRDVIHSFWVPGERFKRDAFPGRETRFSMRFDDEGELLGRCAEFCGLHHAEMNFRIRVVAAAEFDAWTKRGG